MSTTEPLTRSQTQAEGHVEDIITAIDGLFTDATVEPKHVALALLRVQSKIVDGLEFLTADELN